MKDEFITMVNGIPTVCAPVTDRERLIAQALEIVEQSKAGHQHSTERQDWARSILNANMLWRKPK